MPFSFHVSSKQLLNSYIELTFFILFSTFPVFTRRFSDGLEKDTVEVALRGKAALIRNVDDFHIGCREQ